MKNWIDHLGRSLQITDSPERMISLCPSLTETLFALGLQERVVGRTRFCIHPAPDVLQKQNVGGTKQVDFAVIDRLNPDLIIAEKEENTQEMIAVLERKFPVYVVDVKTVEEAKRAIHDLGAITGRLQQAERIVKDVHALFAQVKSAAARKMVYLIWQKPYMAVGKDTYLHSLLTHFGWINGCANLPGRYPEVTLEELCTIQPDVLFLSSEPYPFTDEYRIALQKKLCRTNVVLIDGEISWYGVRMIQAVEEMERVRRLVEENEERLLQVERFGKLDEHTREKLEIALTHWSHMKESDVDDADRFQIAFYHFIDDFTEWWQSQSNLPQEEYDACQLPEVRWIFEQLPSELRIPFEGELIELVEGRKREGDHTEQS